MNDFEFGNVLSKGLTQLIQVPKSDLHNHAVMGGNIEYLSKTLNVDLVKHEGIYDGLDGLKEWSSKCLNPYLKGWIGYLKRVEATFVNAKHDGIVVLVINFSLEEICLFPDVKSFIRMIEKLKMEYAPELVMLPEVSLKWTYDLSFIMNRIEEVLDSGWFYSLDICGRELAQPAENFKQIYAMAKNKGLKLIAHVGETKPAYYVQQVVEQLELDQVHHGITAAESKSVMRFLEKNRIQLNICPYSNIKLGIVKTYSEHPIKILYDNNIPITINSDDTVGTKSNSFTAIFKFI